MLLWFWKSLHLFYPWPLPIKMYNWGLVAAVEYLCELTIRRMASKTMNETVEVIYR